MIKVVFFDVDGTLISHTQGDVPKSTRRCLELLKEKGIKRVLATGRHSVELEDLPVSDIDFDGYILLNGQLCTEKESVFYANPLKNIDALIELFNEKKVPIQLLEKDRFYINFVNDAVRSAQAAIHTPVPDIDVYKGDDVYQAIIFLPKEEEYLMGDLLNDFEVTRWNPYGFDFVSKGASKVVGIQKYMEKEGISLEETMAFGDGENDIEMLKYVHIGVALGNAGDIVKEAADYVTDHIDEDGLEKALIKKGIL